MQTYAETKDFGVQWLGKVPLDWKLCKLKHVSIIKTGSTPKSNEGINIDRLGRMWFTPSDSSANFCLGKSSKYITDEAIAKFNIKLYKPFSVLFVGIGKIGVVGISESESYSNQQITAIQPTAINPRFLLYAIHQLTPALAELAPNTMLPIVNNLMLANTSLVIPSKATQQKIADFLDTETAQIDNLIAKQERLLELLEEKRRATITHAVTRGLNPGVELKETNIPWLAQIPAHWDLVPIKSVAQINNGGDYKDIEVIDGGYPVIGSGGEFARASKYAYDGKSVLFGRKGTIDKPLYFEGRFWTVDTMFWSKINEKKIIPKFLYYIALTMPYDFYQTKTALPSMTQSNLLNHQVAIPDLSEQQGIVESIEIFEDKTSKLQQKIQTQITLLRERRTSLISHAVTGKVRVD